MTEQARAVLGLNVTPFMRGIGKAKAGAKSLGAGLQRSLGFFGLGFGLANLGQRLTDFADKLIETSRKLGVSTDFLQAWNHAAQQNGVSVNASNMALQRFTRRIGEAARGQGVLSKTVQELGINLRDNRGNMRSTTDILADYADAIRGAESQQERLRLAFQAFDSEGAALVTLLQDGSEGMREMIAEATRLGVVTEQRALTAINRLSNRLKAFGTQALGFVAEKLGSFINSLEAGFALFGALSSGAGVQEAIEIARAQVETRNAADELLRIQRMSTEETARQVELERQKSDALKRQAEARRRLEHARGDQSRTTVDELADRDINAALRQHVGINRARAQRVAMLRRQGRHQEADVFQQLIDAGSGINIGFLRNEQQRARSVRAMEAEGRRLAGLGLFQPSQDMFERARNLRANMSELTTAEQRPMQAVEDAVVRGNEELMALNARVKAMQDNLAQLNQ